MRLSWRDLLQPLDLAGLLTLFAVGLALRWMPAEDLWLGWSLLAAFTLAFLCRGLCLRRSPVLGHLLLALMPVAAVLLVYLDPRKGVAQVLLVVWVAMVAALWPPRVVIGAVVVIDVAVYLVLRDAAHPAPLTVTLLYAGFQGFAALTAHYASTAERARDQLARVNADLLATRALLADSARDAERLRVARELHDVAGHKLTAMTLNLRALAADPAFAARDEVRLAQQLSGELLGDIRNVVQALRDTRGLDLVTALHALAAPLPRPRLQLDIAADLQVTDPATAETVLRVVQEALTNSARHGEAGTVHVRMQREGPCLRLDIEDDGRLRAPLREGNGLAGMRERIDAAGGMLSLSVGTRGALRIAAELPL